MSTPAISEVNDHKPMPEMPTHEGVNETSNDRPTGPDAEGRGDAEVRSDRADARPVEDAFEDGGGDAGDGDGDRPLDAARAAPGSLGDALANDMPNGGDDTDTLVRLTQPIEPIVVARAETDESAVPRTDAPADDSPLAALDAVALPTEGDAPAIASLPNAIDANPGLIDAGTAEPNPTETPLAEPATLDAATLDEILPDDVDIAQVVDAAQNGTLPTFDFTPPEGLTQMQFYEELAASGDKTWLVAEATNGNDNIVMRQLDNGDLQLEVNSETADIPSRHRFDLVVRGGEGNDTFTVDDSVTGRPVEDPFIGRASIQYEGGAGDDIMTGGVNAQDTLLGGDGNDTISGRGMDDYVEGGNGNDTIDGGDGRDVLYGGRDNDTITGGAGSDYIDGSSGHDEIRGGEGNDTLAGGVGNDRVFGEGGIDTLLGNSNDPTVTFTATDGTTRSGDVLDGGVGSDRMIYGPNTQIVADAADADPIQVDPQATGPSGLRPGEESVDIVGSDAFIERMESDMEVLRSTQSGQEVLDAVDATGKRFRVREREDGNNVKNHVISEDGYRASIQMDPQRYDLNATSVPVRDPEPHYIAPSPVLLQHEFFHAWEMGEGTFNLHHNRRTNGTRNSELRAVGLPYDQNQDSLPEALDPSVAAISENAIRAELGMVYRSNYERATDTAGFEGDAFAPFRDMELEGVNPPEYDAPFAYDGE
ncbi:MAG: M91 family zinc metallopeptidase [Acidobacteriota bacterium]